MNKLKFYNEYHLGDSGYHIHFCNKLCEYYDDVMITNYIREDLVGISNEFIEPVYKDRIVNKPLGEKPDDAINSWINRNNDYNIWISNIFTFDSFDIFYIEFYNRLFGECGYINPVNTVDKFLFDHTLITNPIKSITTKYDFIIINSIPMSGQWGYNESQFDTLISKLVDKGYSVITTKKSRTGVDCTLDMGYTLMDIGVVSTNCKYVIGVHTAPWLYTLNKESINNIEFFICLQNQGVGYSFSNVFSVRSSFDEVYNILELKGINL